MIATDQDLKTLDSELSSIALTYLEKRNEQLGSEKLNKYQQWYQLERECIQLVQDFNTKQAVIASTQPPTTLNNTFMGHMKTINQKMQERASLVKRLKEIENRLSELDIWSNAWGSLNNDKNLIKADIAAIDKQLAEYSADRKI